MYFELVIPQEPPLTQATPPRPRRPPRKPPPLGQGPPRAHVEVQVIEEPAERHMHTDEDEDEEDDADHAYGGMPTKR